MSGQFQIPTALLRERHPPLIKYKAEWAPESVRRKYCLCYPFAV